MTNTKRTDCHSPSQFVPEHYRYLDVLDLYAGTEKDDVSRLAVHTNIPGSWTAHVDETARKVASFREQAIGDRPAMNQCSICGHHIRYAVIWSFEPDGERVGLITSGLDCAENVDAANLSDLRDKVGALQEFVAGVRKSVRDAEQAHAEMPVRTAADEEEDSWIAQDPSHAELAGFLNSHAQMHVDLPEECVLCSFALQLAQKGRLSEKQVSWAMDLAARAEPILPPEGEGIEVVGWVRSVKVHQTTGSMHALIDVPERRSGLRKVQAHRVWLPVKKALPRSTQVRFVANLSASRQDPTFLVASNVSGQSILS